MFLRKAIKFFIPISNAYVNDTTSLHPWEDLVVLTYFYFSHSYVCDDISLWYFTWIYLVAIEIE